ncbi:oligoribonuclease, mitochondrial-like [Anoplophora glabripennis]|uniref:oligoribonuclease, mitochondrial-like n=1 Tax=Anoplophora glabripennis TaxID=217634 RepID=UPI0008758017|nr:oligoribonuclease, mitochondrial-like [Anoplophora glabripennis]
MYRFLLNHVLNSTKRNFKTMSLVNGVNGHGYSQNTFDLEVNRIIWVDMEMTGLDLEKDKIMEVACLVTDSELNIVAEGPDIIIHQPEDLLRNMDEWCINQHGKTGLTQACLKSNVTVEDAENALLDFVKKYVTERHSPLAGNSVYMDRMFLKKFMPRLNEYLHYRIIDVSTIKEVCRRWNPALYKQLPKKEYSHRALQDIKESVEELRFYKTNFFKSC